MPSDLSSGGFAPLVVVGGLGRSREGISKMEKRRNFGLIGRARRVLVVGVPAVGLAVAMVGAAPAESAFAQDSDIGASIAATVAAAVSGIATDGGDGSNAVGGISVQENNVDLGEQEGTAISDASGGSYNVAPNPETGG